MNILDYLKPMNMTERDGFARRCGTTLGHLLNVAYDCKPCSPGLAMAIEDESGGAVRVEEAAPGYRWHVIRGAEPPSRDIDRSCAKAAEKLAALRQAGLTGAEIARRTGVPQPTISRIERGVHLHPKELAVRAIDALYAAVISQAA